MFKYIYIILPIFIIISARPVFADSVGTVKDSKTSLYAVIGAENKGKKLYIKGDIFFSDKDHSKGLRILDIKENMLILEDVASKNSIAVGAGQRIPLEGLGLIFEKTFEADVLEYSYSNPRKKFTKNQIEDFTIKSLEKKRIALEKPYNAASVGDRHAYPLLSDKEKGIFNSPRDQNADKKVIITELFNKIESKKIGDNTWALNRPDAESAIHNAGAALMSAIKRVEPRYRLGEGPSLKFNTDLGTAVINKEGFLVQNIAVAKLSENFGIREGDVIKSINGYPVNNLLGIYRAYENIASDKGAKVLSIDIARDGKAKTLVYKIK